METNKTLINILYRFFALAFWFTTTLVIVGFSFEIFTEKGEVGSFSSGAHHSKGYPLPVTLTVQLPNAIFNNQKLINRTEGINELG